jgi:hypothetical protein
MYRRPPHPLHRIVLKALAVIALGAFALPASAQTTPGTPDALVGWSDIVGRALATWEQRNGENVSRHQQAVRDAGDWQGGRWTDALIMPVPGFGIRPDSPGSGDNYVTAVFRMEARNLAPQRGAALDAVVGSIAGNADRARFDFAMQVVQQWLVLWQATSLTAHLEEDLAEFASMVTDWTSQDPGGFVTTADRVELETELARIQFELGEARWELTAAQRQLEATLQTRETPDVDGFPDIADPATAMDPWGLLASEVDDHPILAEQNAQSAALAAAARLAWNSNPTIIGFGTEIHDSWMGQFYAAALLEITVPLARRHRAGAATDLAEAERMQQDVRVVRNALVAQLQADHDLWVERSQHLSDLQRTWIAPLRERVMVWQERAISGLPDFPAYVAAQRALHEAEHALYIEELASSARYFYAAAMVDTITEIQQ